MKSRTLVAARANERLLAAHVSNRDQTAEADKEVRVVDALELFDTPVELFWDYSRR